MIDHGNLYKLTSLLGMNHVAVCVFIGLIMRFCVSALALGGTIDALATEDPDATQEEEEELQVYEKHNPLLHGSKKLKYVNTYFISLTFCVFYL